MTDNVDQLTSDMVALVKKGSEFTLEYAPTVDNSYGVVDDEYRTITMHGYKQPHLTTDIEHDVKITYRLDGNGNYRRYTVHISEVYWGYGEQFTVDATMDDILEKPRFAARLFP